MFTGVIPLQEYGITTPPSLSRTTFSFCHFYQKKTARIHDPLNHRFIYRNRSFWYDLSCQEYQTSQSRCATQCINRVSGLRNESRRITRLRRPASGKSHGDTRGQCPSRQRELPGKCPISSRCRVVPSRRRETQRFCRRNNRRSPGEKNPKHHGRSP